MMYAELEKKADEAYQKWRSLTEKDPQGRAPDVFLRDREAYLLSHPGDLRAARSVSEFRAKEAKLWAEFEAIYNCLLKEIGCA